MPAGRPSEYRTEFADLARILCDGGATDQDLAQELGVGISTIKIWKAKHPEFRTAVKLGKDIADERVVNSLYNRAMGYSHEAVKILTVSQGANAGSEVQEVPYIEHYPPDTTAMIFWLKNRKPAEWRERQEIASDVTVKSDIDVSKLTKAERDVLRELIGKASPEKE